MDDRRRNLLKGLVPLFWLCLIASILGLLNPMKWPNVARLHAGFLAACSILVLIFFVALAMNTDLVRDTTPQPPPGKRRPYSLSRVQAAFWLCIVSIVYLRMLSFASQPLQPPVPNETALVLLSLSVVTVAASAYVGTRSNNGQSNGAQKEGSNATGTRPASRGLISDILNDSGTNLHRLQLILWNAMLGIDYLYEGLTQPLIPTPMPTYGKEIYALLGISSAAYVVLKGGEDPKGSGSN